MVDAAFGALGGITVPTAGTHEEPTDLTKSTNGVSSKSSPIGKTVVPRKVTNVNPSSLTTVGTGTSTPLPVKTTIRSPIDYFTSARLPPPGPASVLIRPALKDTKKRDRKMTSSHTTGTATVPHTMAVILVEIFLNSPPTPSRGVTVTRVTTSLGTLGSPTPASPGKHPHTTEVAKIPNTFATPAPTRGVVTGTISPLCASLPVSCWPYDTMTLAPVGPTSGLSNKARFRKEMTEIHMDSYGTAKFPAEVNTTLN